MSTAIKSLACEKISNTCDFSLNSYATHTQLLRNSYTLTKEFLMTYVELYNKALCVLCLIDDEVDDYRPADPFFIPELK